MSELNEELLNDDIDDFPEIGEAEEDALLQEDEDGDGDGDVLDIVDEELGESESDQKHATDSEEMKTSRQDKFATERKRVTAPEPVVTLNDQKQNNRFARQNNRGRGRGGRQQQGRFQQHNNHQGRQYYNSNQPGRSKTVLINPRFQGVVHVNNNGKGARLAWDTHQQQYQPNSWNSVGSGSNIGPSPPVSSVHSMQPHPQMQGPPQMQFQPQMQQFQGPPQMQAIQGPPQHMQQQTPMQNMGFPGQQMQFMPSHQQGFLPQPLPPGVPHAPMQPPNPPAPSSYWDGQSQTTSVPQRPNQQVMPYMQNNFESQRPPVVMNMNQPPPRMQNYQYHNQFNNGPPMQHQQLQEHHQNFAPNQNYIQQNPSRQVFNNNRNIRRPNQGMQNKKDMVSPKRKVGAMNFVQNKKRFVHDRLGSVEHSQIKVTVKGEDRPSVVKEVTVTNVTTVKIEDDEQTRDLRLKIEEQKRKREQVLRWKELRRQENLKQVKTQKQLHNSKQQQGQGRGKAAHQQQHRMNQHHIGASGRAPVLQPIKQIDDSKQLKLGGGVQKASQNVGQRVITAQTVVPLEQPEVDQKHLSNFLADRKVLVKDESLMSTRKVVIKNISTSTGDKKIIQICKNIGDVQKLHRDKNERHATITFKSVASAHAFFKKYQRHMLDLSMIEVSLTPESDGQE